ncbi:MAG: START domain-containing protein [Polyangia bacterium]|jgi:hypothetical protein
MLRLFFTTAVFMSVVSPTQFASAESERWELVGSKDDIVTYRREVAGSPVIAIRGEGVVEASILRVASVLMDTARLPQWMDRVAEARRIRATSALHYVEYERASTPFPLTDRDFVIESWVEIDGAKKQMVLRARSVSDPSTPLTSLVRGEVLSSTFTLTALDRGQRTRVVAEVHTDPKGSIPKWMVNLVQKSWAHTTIMGLRAQVRKANVPDNAEVKGLLEKAGGFE